MSSAANLTAALLLACSKNAPAVTCQLTSEIGNTRERKR